MVIRRLCMRTYTFPTEVVGIGELYSIYSWHAAGLQQSKWMLSCLVFTIIILTNLFVLEENRRIYVLVQKAKRNVY